MSVAAVSAILLGGAGLLIGSYLATVALRWPRGASASLGRSRCDGCGRPLAVRDLVPLLSYARARGRCRQCAARIDPRHPLIELAALAVGAACGWTAPGLAGLAGALFGWTLLLLAVLDFDHYWLPDRLTLSLIGLGLAGALVGPPPLADRALGALGGFAALALVAAAYRRLRGRDGLGGGDAKLFAAIGAWLGWQALPAVLVLATLMALAAVAVGVLAGRRASRLTAVPLGAALAAAGWACWVLAATGAAPWAV